MISDSSFSDLKNKHVFITGGGLGIGAFLTRGFSFQGCKVSFVQRSSAKIFIDKLKQEKNIDCFYVKGDISDVDQLDNAIDKAKKKFGEIHILINNASNDAQHTIDDLSPQAWEKNLAVNLRSYFFAIQKVIPEMKKKNKGVIINVASSNYLTAQKGAPAYVIANAGITGLTRSAARELGRYGIRVNSLIPGWVLTEKQLNKRAEPADLKKHIRKQCLKTHLAPSDMVDPALFLASNASKMMTGQALVVDGGVVFTG